MRKALAYLLAVTAAPSLAAAGELELAGYAGYTFPFYSQTFRYDPGPITVPIPGVTIEQNGAFELKAAGGPAFAGALTFYPTGSLGFELRYDHADMTVETKSAGFTVRAGLPPPLDPVVADLTLTKGTANVEAAGPLSLNLKIRTGESLRFTLSGGASRLPDLGFSLQQTVALGVVAVNLQTGNLEIATIALRGVAAAEAKSTWGGNLGLGFQIPIGERGAFVVEGRGFYFPKRTIEWEVAPGATLPALQQELLKRLLQRLEPIEFEPWWAQATAGFAIRF